MFLDYNGVHALLGANGAGKSTLMKVLAGIVNEYEGQIYLNGKEIKLTSPHAAMAHGIGMVHQELSVLPNITVAENVYLNRFPKTKLGTVDWNKLYDDCTKILESLGLSIDPRMMLGKLTVADRQMVEIAKVLSMNPRIILLDEPTSALSEMEIQRLLELIRTLKKNHSIVFITHKLDEMLAVSDKITILRDGKLLDTIDVVDKTNPSEKELVSKMIGVSSGDLSEMFPQKSKETGEVILEVEGLTNKGVYEDISFNVKKGEVVVFTGLKGAKRTEVMRAVFGADPFTHGTIKVRGEKLKTVTIQNAVKSGMAMVTEDRKGEGIVPLMMVKDHISMSTISESARAGFINKEKLGEKAKTYVDKLKIKVHSINDLITSLSGGNQQKVVLSKWLAANPDILILDEPTRGIDVGAKIEIYKLIRQVADEGTAVLVVTSELPEAIGLADRLYVMVEGKMIGELSEKDIDTDKIMHMMFGQRIGE